MVRCDMKAKDSLERAVKYAIREAKYLKLGGRRAGGNGLDGSIGDAVRCAAIADEMSKADRIAESARVARDVFDRFLEREERARELSAESEWDVLNFLKRESVLRLLVDCALDLRDWDDEWVLAMCALRMALVVGTGDTLGMHVVIARSEMTREIVARDLEFKSSFAPYAYLVARLKNAKANRGTALDSLVFS